MKGWEERIAADPQFTYKVFVEQVSYAMILVLMLTTLTKGWVYLFNVVEQTQIEMCGHR